jgi:cytidyltransferase-like protein
MNNKPRRVYIDGIFDLFHRGHVECLKKAKEFLNGPVELIVGIVSDVDAETYKRKPIYNEEDRYVIIRSISYVDEVILGSPLYLTKDFVKRHRIDCIVHGFSDCRDFEKQKEFFKDVEDIFYQIPYYKHLSTTEILKKIKDTDIDKK